MSNRSVVISKDNIIYPVHIAASIHVVIKWHRNYFILIEIHIFYPIQIDISEGTIHYGPCAECLLPVYDTWVMETIIT